jgi:hypothetical protein
MRPLTSAQRRAGVCLAALASLLLVWDFTPRNVHTPCGGIARRNGAPGWSPAEVCGAQRSGAVLACGLSLLLIAAIWLLRSRAPILIATAASSCGLLAVYAERRSAASPLAADGSLLAPFWEGTRNLWAMVAVTLAALALYLWFRTLRPIEEDTT